MRGGGERVAVEGQLWRGGGGRWRVDVEKAVRCGAEGLGYSEVVLCVGGGVAGAEGVYEHVGAAGEGGGVGGGWGRGVREGDAEEAAFGAPVRGTGGLLCCTELLLNR